MKSAEMKGPTDSTFCSLYSLHFNAQARLPLWFIFSPDPITSIGSVLFFVSIFPVERLAKPDSALPLFLRDTSPRISCLLWAALCYLPSRFLPPFGRADSCGVVDRLRYLSTCVFSISGPLHFSVPCSWCCQSSQTSVEFPLLGRVQPPPRMIGVGCSSVEP